jgi:hypothetical protein
VTNPDGRQRKAVFGNKRVRRFQGGPVLGQPGLSPLAAVTDVVTGIASLWKAACGTFGVCLQGVLTVVSTLLR